MPLVVDDDAEILGQLAIHSDRVEGRSDKVRLSALVGVF